MRSLLKIAISIAALVVMFGAGWLIAVTGTGQAIRLESLSELEPGIFVFKPQGAPFSPEAQS